jgi:hypothetical protein
MKQEARITVGLRFGEYLEAQVAKTMTANAAKVCVRDCRSPTKKTKTKSSSLFVLTPILLRFV